MGVEIYRSSRFFIVTGKKFVYDEIIENQQAIDYVINKYFPEAERDSDGNEQGKRIYSPVYAAPTINNIPLQPTYPPIPQGMRNLSLTSLAGQMHTQGYSPKDIYSELIKANNAACTPPLPSGEVRNIVKSVTRYRR
jgi:hypothetical protein